MSTNGRPASAALVSAGLGTTFLADLTQAVATFTASSATADTGRLDHIGAHADFGAVAREMMELVRPLDGLNTVRFKDQSKLLAEWDAARNVFGSSRAKAAVPDEGASPTPGADVPPTAGVTQAAA